MSADHRYFVPVKPLLLHAVLRNFQNFQSSMSFMNYLRSKIPVLKYFMPESSLVAVSNCGGDWESVPEDIFACKERGGALGAAMFGVQAELVTYKLYHTRVMSLVGDVEAAGFTDEAIELYEDLVYNY